MTLPQPTPRFCLVPGCPRYSNGSGYCDAHAPVVRAQTHRAYDMGPRDQWARRFYKSAAWRKFREVVLQKFPICQDCEVLPSCEVHHIVKARTRKLLLSFRNVLALCKSCHSKRTARGE